MSWLVADKSTDFSLVRPRAKLLAREHRELKAKLIKIRRDAGLSQADVADRMDVTQQTVSKFERYDSDPKLSTIRRYANAVGALIEHEVEVDRGQSRYLAAQRSSWAQGNRTTTYLAFDDFFSRFGVITHESQHWVSAAAKTTEFEVVGSGSW